MKSSVWLPPLAALVLAACGSFGSLYLDRYVFEGLLGSLTLSDPDAARDVLSVIATAMLTLTVLVFSITMVVLQLASAQYSPRVTQSFLRDKQTKFSLSVFLGTFAYSLVLLRAVRSEARDRSPNLADHHLLPGRRQFDRLRAVPQPYRAIDPSQSDHPPTRSRRAQGH